MADYDVSGAQSAIGLNGASNLVPYVYANNVKTVNGDAWSMGMFSSDTYNEFVNRNAMSGNGHTATDCWWIYKLNEQRYIGLIAVDGTNSGYINGFYVYYCRQPNIASSYRISVTSSFSINRTFLENTGYTFWYLWVENNSLNFRLGAMRYGAYITKASLDAANLYAGAVINVPLNLKPSTLPKIADTSEAGGGGGTLDISSDTIGFPIPPTISAVGSGVLALFNPTVAQLKNLSDWLWTNDVFTTLQKFVASPMDLIISLSIFPVAPTISAGTQVVKIGGISTGAEMALITEQYLIFDCGTINLAEYYGSALDYGQYTKISIYLPYIGVREIKTDEVMSGSIQVKYNIDLLTGACVAMVRCTRSHLDAVLYSFEGNMSAQLPLTSKDFSQVYSAILRGVLDTTVSGGFTNAKVGSAMAIMGSKPIVSRAGSISGNGGHLCLHTPYIILERPIQSLAKNYNHYNGSPSNITAQLSTLSGYTEVAELVQTNIHCTLDEFDEITELLKEGVYL